MSGNSGTQFISVGDRIDKVYLNTFQRTTDGQIINDANQRSTLT